MADAISDSVGVLAERNVAGRNLTLLLVLAAGLLPAGASKADPLGPESAKLDMDRLQPGLYPAAPGLTGEWSEAPHTPFHLDWSIGLKGAYTSSNTGGYFLTTLNPAFTARHDGQRTDIVIEGDGTMARQWDNGGHAGLTALRLGLSTDSALDANMRVKGNAAINFGQALPGTQGLNADIITPPQVLSGSAGLGIERSFGQINLALKGNVERAVYGPTMRRDTGRTDNADQNLWQADAILRAGVQVTPILEVFSEATLGRDMFDAASPTLGVRTDATSTALRGGIAGNWNGIVRASASIGRGKHDFDAAGLTDIDTWLYDASLSFSPDPTLNLTASLSSAVEPTGSDSNGTARVVHTAQTKLDYTVNSWLRLRASADWGLSRLEGNGETEQRRGLGAGADYAVNKHTALSADYGYGHRDNSNNGQSDTHTISVGITLRR